MTILVDHGHDISGTTATRPTTVDAGESFYNSTTGRWEVYTGSAWVAAGIQSSALGAKNGATVTAAENGSGAVQQTVLTCTATPLTFGDEAGQGQYGGVKVYDMPAGLILTMGAVISGNITLTAPAIDAWNGDIGLGVAVVSDHQDASNKIGQILQTSATTIASSKVAAIDNAVTVATALTESGARWRDGTATAIDIYMNVLVDDNVAHDNTITGLFTGVITLIWANLGDN